MADLTQLRNLTAQIERDRGMWERMICDLVTEGKPISHIADAAGISRTHVRRLCFGR